METILSARDTISKTDMTSGFMDLMLEMGWQALNEEWYETGGGGMYVTTCGSGKASPGKWVSLTCDLKVWEQNL